MKLSKIEFESNISELVTVKHDFVFMPTCIVDSLLVCMSSSQIDEYGSYMTIIFDISDININIPFTLSHFLESNHFNHHVSIEILKITLVK